MAQLAFPRRLIIGGASSTIHVRPLLESLGLQKPLIISDPFLLQSGVVEKVRNGLGNMSCAIFTDTIPDPTTDSVERCRAKLKDGNYDSIIAVGGGSPMDTAKAAGVLSCHGGSMKDYKAPFQFNKPSLPIIAIPTTAGTGSEVTKFTIITDSLSGEKMLCIGLSYLPYAAVIDYELTLSMPWRLTADTGIDAFCHAMEAFVSVKHNVFSDSLALASIRKIGSNIKTACENPMDMHAREQMMVASTEAGMAFSNSSVTLIHGMSRPIGAHFHVPHGLSNAMLAPRVTAFSVSGAVERYAAVSYAFGACNEGTSLNEASSKLADYLQDLNTKLRVPTMQQWGIKEAEFMSAIPQMAQEALASGSPNNNPVIPNASQIENLYHEIWSHGAH